MARPSDEFRRRLDSWKDAREIGDELQAEITGKFQAQPSSSAPPSKLSHLAIAWLMVKKFPPWGAVIVALAGIAAYVLLRR